MEGGDYHSTALNFVSRIRGSVDPRTGIYSATIELVTGEGNQLRGPSFGFQLAYQPTIPTDEGFGEGWALRVTRYDRKSRQLALASGECYVANALEAEKNATFDDRKIETFRFRPGSDFASAVVEHVDGLTEHLALPGGRGDVLKPIRIVKQNGDSLTLVWDELPSGGVGLRRVIDDDGVVLLSLDYPNLDEVRLTMASGQKEPMQFRFVRTRQLLRVELTTMAEHNAEALSHGEEMAIWRFGYRALGSPAMTVLESVTSPNGVMETVRYAETALKMPPGAPRQAMPAAVERVQSRVGAPSVVIECSRYDYRQYGDHNCYGYGHVRSWQSGRDQLIHTIGTDRYLYGSTETVCDVDLTTSLLSIERTFNQFHLQTLQKTTRGNVVTEVVTTYGDDREVPFLDQPTTFQLPTRVTTRRYDKRYPAVCQETWEQKRHDNVGNVVSHVMSATGTEEAFEYFSADGETDSDGVELCPPDPLRLVRRLRSRRLTPGPGGGAVVTRVYRYLAVDVLASKASGLTGRTYYVQSRDEVVRTDEGTELFRATREYVSDPSRWHGSLEKESLVRDGLATCTTLARDVGETSITTTTVTRTYDGLEAVARETRQHISGLTIASEDAFGNRSETTYDPLGRKIRHVASPGSPAYEAVMTWRYQVSSHERWAERTGVTGLRHRTWMDERGNVIRVDGPQTDGALVTLSTSSWDALGQRVEDVVVDVVDHDRRIELSARASYDDWGRACHVVQPDGRVARADTMLVVDPASPGEVWTRVLTWTEAGNAKSAWTAVIADASGLTRRTEAGTWLGRRVGPVDSASIWEYDGLGRCVCMHDAMDQVTRQTWDAEGRLMTTTLPDGTVVHRLYANGSAGGEVASLDVTPDGETIPIALGQRTFDGWGRRIEERAGTLMSTLAYQGVGSRPSVSALPSGATVERLYDTRIGGVLIHSELVEGGERSTLLKASYDGVTGLPVAVASAVDVMDITADPLGRLTRQDISLDGDIQRSVETIPSLAGRELTKQLADGTRQSLHYDDVGRLVLMSDGDIQATFEYDEFSRLVKRIAGAADGRTMTARWSYDAYGRLDRQDWSYAGGERPWVRHLELTWRRDNKLLARRWLDEADTAVCTETLEYDARGRMVVHAVVSDPESECPRDDEGHPWRRQTFEYDALDNLVKVHTTLLDGRINTTTYRHDPLDHDRVVGFTHTQPSYPGGGAEVAVTYDKAGNVTDDGQGRDFGWDGAGRLAWMRVASGQVIHYRYGPDTRVAKVVRNDRTFYRYYDNDVLVCEMTDTEGRRFVRTAGGPVAETRFAQACRQAILLAADPQGSVIADDRNGLGMRRYEAYGHTGNAVDIDAPAMAYAGQIMEAEGLYMLGSRLYSARLRRFLNPDGLSPFGAGGLNRYAYCGGDPIGRVDPSGQSWLDWLITGVGLAAAVVGTVLSFGALAGAAAATVPSLIVLGMAATLDAVSLAAEVGSVVGEAIGDSTLEQTMGWIAFGTGLAAGGAAQLAKTAGKAAKGMSRFADTALDVTERTVGDVSFIGRATEDVATRNYGPGGDWMIDFSGTRSAEHTVSTKRTIQREGRNTTQAHFRATRKNGMTYYAGDAPVAGKDIADFMELLPASPSRTRQIVHLHSGIDGSPSGINFGSGPSGGPLHANGSFYARDKVMAKRWADENPESDWRIKVHNRMRYDKDELPSLLMKGEPGDVHFIYMCYAACCEELSAFLGVDPARAVSCL